MAIDEALACAEVLPSVLGMALASAEAEAEAEASAAAVALWPVYFGWAEMCFGWVPWYTPVASAEAVAVAVALAAASAGREPELEG